MANGLFNATMAAVTRVKLRAHPLCEACLQFGYVEPATPWTIGRRSMPAAIRFPPIDQLASLCERCHNRKTRGEQLGRELLPKVWGCDERGWPLDPDHPWNWERKT